MAFATPLIPIDVKTMEGKILWHGLVNALPRPGDTVRLTSTDSRNDPAIDDGWVVREVEWELSGDEDSESNEGIPTVFVVPKP